MKDWEAYRKRFLQDAIPVRLGGVSANLARVKSASRNDQHLEVVRDMIQDTEYLIEWTAPDLEAETASELVEIQVQLAHWCLTWESVWNDIDQRRAVAEQAGHWSEKILDLSGLLNDETYDKYNIPRR
ncbi:MAG: hypothetical protein HY741_05655 [Chloroflexi bacterium]|nr:hypothetical protein [Chloroflexota bacterium]